MILIIPFFTSTKFKGHAHVLNMKKKKKDKRSNKKINTKIQD